MVRPSSQAALYCSTALAPALRSLTQPQPQFQPQVPLDASDASDFWPRLAAPPTQPEKGGRAGQEKMHSAARGHRRDRPALAQNHRLPMAGWPACLMGQVRLDPRPSSTKCQRAGSRRAVAMCHTA